MRYLFAAILLVFSCLFLSETTKGAQASVNTSQGASIKAKVCQGKTLLEAITVVPRPLKKPSSLKFLFISRPDWNQDTHILTCECASIGMANSYNYIFDFLYPKHVFW